MIAQFVNAAAVVAGTLIGLFFQKFFTEKISRTVNNALALCVLYIGINGTFKETDNVLYIIFSMAIGALLGELIDIDEKINILSQWVESRFSHKDRKVSVAEGFLNSTLLFCVGAMAIVGSLNAGISKDYSIIFAKSAIDCVSSILYASTMGIGVMLSAASVLLYQGLLTLLSSFLAPLLSEQVIANMNIVGSLLLIGLSLNMLNVTRIKVANLLPAVFIPIIINMFL